MHRIIDGEFHHWKEFGPTRKGVDISSKDLFEETVCTFRLTICFRMVKSRHFQPCSKERNTVCQNPALNRGCRSDTSSRGKPWSRNTVSIKTRAQPCAVNDSGTAAICPILLKRSTNTCMCLHETRRQSPWYTDFQHSAGTSRGCNGARDEGLGFTQ